MKTKDRQSLTIGVVGPCGAGKSTLVTALISIGFQCRHIAQEHSYVPHMWRYMVNPDILIFLEASFSSCTRRRQLLWLESDYTEQILRLAHARSHANLVIQTDGLTQSQVLARVVEFLDREQ